MLFWYCKRTLNLNLVDESTDKSVMTCENGANWELFPIAKKRFFLKDGIVGPAYLSANSLSMSSSYDLNEIIDFENKDKNKLHILFKKCPVLIRKSLGEIFPGK